MKRLITFFILHSLITCGFASNPIYNFKRITTSNGLSNSWVRCFFQDEFGFIWIGTADGLNRYDGYSFKTFRPYNDDNFEIGNFTVNKIIEKDSLNLWICTHSGIYNFNLQTESITIDTLLSPHPVLTAAKGKNEVYWFGTNHGLYKYNSHQNEKIEFNSKQKNSKSIVNDYINNLLIDSENNLWIGTKKGLNFLANNSTQFSQVLFENYDFYDVLAICEDKHHRIWVGTANKGLFVISHTQNNFETTKIIDGNISSLTIDNMQQLWIGYSNDAGIEIFDLNAFDNGKLSSVIIEKNPTDETSLADNSTFCFFNDQLGDLWIGSFTNGISYFSLRSKPFYNISVKINESKSISNNLVNAFYEEDKYLWIGTEAGLDKFDKETGNVEHFKHNPSDLNSLGSSTILSIYKDSKGYLWVGTWSGGLNRFNYSKNNFKRFSPDENNPNSISSPNIFTILEDSENNLWIGTNAGGLNLFNYADESFTVFTNDSEDSSSLGGRSINSMIETASGDLYISLYSVLEHYNREQQNFNHISLYNKTKNYTSGSISYLFEDSNNNLWLATNIGLELYNPLEKNFKRYTINNGLPDNSVHAILEDNHKNLWLSTNKGISKFLNGTSAPDTPTFLNFSIDDGLPTNNFLARSCYKNKEGIMYFGSTKGYIYFNPDSITLNTITPKIVLTNFLIQESHPNESTNYQPIKKNINLISKINLYYPNTDFIIGFAALNYLNSEKNNFKYKLEGYDTEWVVSNYAQTASYTNLKEGEYTFKVIGANNDGLWSNTAAEIKIKVHPPWWQSLIFKIIIFASVFLIGITIIYVRFKDLRNQNKVLEAKVDKRTNELTKLNELLEEKQIFISQQNNELEIHRNQLEQLVNERTTELNIARKKAEESDKLKSAFLANMSHEIRTPLNAIMGFSAILGKPDLTPAKRDKYIKHIENNGKALSLLVSDILDISIIEANQMVLSKTTISVNSLLNELYLVFEQENKNNLEFIYSNANNKYDFYVTTDAFRLRQVLINLLSNAFKYTDTGSIKYGFSADEKNIQFYISDTGIGIKEKDMERIFELFYKSDKEKSKLYRGTGIGLAICKKLINQLGGNIWVESEFNVGTTFYFTLPLKSNTAP